MLSTFHDIYAITMGLLPPDMAQERARSMLIAIGLQESRFAYRKQIGGPARGFWQFERGGIRGVLNHDKTMAPIRGVLAALKYQPLEDQCYEAVAHNDVLAMAFARLLLFTVPEHLPGRYEADKAWDQYMWAWRPGRPHRESWNAFFDEAWSA